MSTVVNDKELWGPRSVIRIGALGVAFKCLSAAQDGSLGVFLVVLPRISIVDLGQPVDEVGVFSSTAAN